MKAARHHGGKEMHRKDGGPMVDKGREEDEEKQMEEGHSKGGRVKRKRGGGMEHSEGMMAAKRHDRPGRKRGGGVGSDKRPLTSAANASNADGHSTDADEVNVE